MADAVCAMTQLQWEASRVAQLYTLDAVERQAALKKTDTGFYYNLLICCSR